MNDRKTNEIHRVPKEPMNHNILLSNVSVAYKRLLCKNQQSKTIGGAWREGLGLQYFFFAFSDYNMHMLMKFRNVWANSLWAILDGGYIHSTLVDAQVPSVFSLGYHNPVRMPEEALVAHFDPMAAQPSNAFWYVFVAKEHFTVFNTKTNHYSRNRTVAGERALSAITVVCWVFCTYFLELY